MSRHKTGDRRYRAFCARNTVSWSIIELEQTKGIAPLWRLVFNAPGAALALTVICKTWRPVSDSNRRELIESQLSLPLDERDLTFLPLCPLPAHTLPQKTILVFGLLLRKNSLPQFEHIKLYFGL